MNSGLVLTISPRMQSKWGWWGVGVSQSIAGLSITVPGSSCTWYSSNRQHIFRYNHSMSECLFEKRSTSITSPQRPVLALQWRVVIDIATSLIDHFPGAVISTHLISSIARSMWHFPRWIVHSLTSFNFRFNCCAKMLRDAMVLSSILTFHCCGRVFSETMKTCSCC